MDFRKEAKRLREFENIKFINANELEIVQEMSSSLERNDLENFKNCYMGYYSIVRNLGKYNEECFNLSRKIYEKLI